MTKGLVTCFVFALISLGVGIYCYQWASPSVASYARILPEMKANSDLYETTLTYWEEAVEKEHSLSLISMFAGAVGLLGGAYYGVKYKRRKKRRNRSRFGWCAVILSLVGLFLGLLAGTQLFN